MRQSLLPTKFLLLTAYCLLLTLLMGCETEEKTGHRALSIENKEIAGLKGILKKDPTLWRERHRLGVMYMTNERYQEAIEEFMGVLAVKPDSVEALQSLGMTYYRMGKRHKAVSYWRSLLEIQPENKLVWGLIRKLEDQTSDSAGTAENSKQSAHESGEERDKTLARWAEHYKKGQDYYAGNDYSRALEEFEMAVKYNPSDHRTYFSIGAIYNAQGDMDKAIESWRSALKLKPDDLMIMKLMTLAKTRKEREKEVKKAKEQVEKEPENWRAHESLASLYAAAKNRDTRNKAADEYREVIRLNSAHIPAYEKLADISFSLRKYDDGLDYLSDALKLNPENQKIKRRIEVMKSYNRLYQTGRKEWKEGGVERYKEMALIKGFYIDRYEVTNARYKEFLGNDNNGRNRPPRHWKKGRYREGRDNYPVVNVDWYMANLYCKAVGKRLPTEEEWEKAARGIEGKRIYPWGIDFDKDRANSKESGFKALTPGGVFKDGASPYGVYDMAGNAEEWTASGYKESKQLSSGRNESKEAESNDFPFPPTNYKVRRGGSFKSDRIDIRVVSRTFAFPTDVDGGVGFRCAQSVMSQ